MKKKFLSLYLLILTASFGIPCNASSFDTGNTEVHFIQTVDKKELVANGKSGSVSTGESSSNGTSSSHDSQQQSTGSKINVNLYGSPSVPLTEEELEEAARRELQREYKEQLLTYIERLWEEAKEKTYGSGSGLNVFPNGKPSDSHALIAEGSTGLTPHEFEQMFRLLRLYKEAGGDSRYLFDTTELHSELEAAEEVTEEEYARFMELIAEKEGGIVQKRESYSTPMFFGDYGLFSYDPLLGMFNNGVSVMDPNADQKNLLDYIVSGGLVNYEDYYNTFNGMNTFYNTMYLNRPSLTTSMEDFFTLIYLKDIRITKIKKKAITVIDYTSDVRYWTIYDENGQALTEPIITDNPTHSFVFSGYPAGTYYITAVQLAHVREQREIEYGVYEYLFDNATKTILRSRRRTSESSPNNSVLDSYMPQESIYVPTGTTYKVIVNDLGNASINGKLTERTQ